MAEKVGISHLLGFFLCLSGARGVTEDKGRVHKPRGTPQTHYEALTYFQVPIRYDG